MRNIKILTIAAMAIFTFFACNKNNEPNNTTVSDGSFSGTLNVAQPDSTTFTRDTLKVQFLTTEKTDSAVLYLLRVRFSEAMATSAGQPILIYMKMPVKVSVSGNQVNFSGDNVTPLTVQGGVELPFPAFQANQISGTILGNNLAFTMTLHSVTGMGQAVPAGTDYPMDYWGAKISE